MSLIDVMHEYFRGEKQVGMLLVGLGVGLAALGAWAAKSHGGAFGWSLAIPLLLVGIGATIGGGFFVTRTNAQVAELERGLTSDEAATLAVEIPRMEKVNANWPRLKIAWTVLTVIALALVVVVKRDWSNGLGLALLLLCAIIMCVDVFAERRAKPYTEALADAAADERSAVPDAER